MSKSSALINQTQTSGDLTAGLATLGKVSFTLLFIIAFILLCAWLIRRFGSGYLPVAGSAIRIVASANVGPKEKVMIVDMLDKRLAIGVTAQQITLLRESEIPADAEQVDVNTQAASPGFSQLLRRSLQRNKTEE
ncbi:MAG: flagellar biosynthetic protein FliO [Gammaproteobacteria bacterium]|nr:flagellar biosynthetic protein FliO [Gammaproteobacteria bacterium]